MILVTGATGLVGGHLLWHLLQKHPRIAALRRPTSNLEPLRTIFSFYTPNVDEYLQRIEWIFADVTDAASIENALDGISTIYHCAAVVSLGGKGNSMSDTNIAGTRNMVDAAIRANISNFCFVSSIAACGYSSEGKKVDEDMEWIDSETRSAYSRSKYYSEQEVWKGIEKGLPAVIVNPGVILGISGANTGSSKLFVQMQKGLLFYTNGGSGYVDVRDVVQAMIALTEKKMTGERYILVGENCSNKDILQWMAKYFGTLKPILPIGRSLLLTVGAAAEVLGKWLGFSPLIDKGTARSATHREYYSSEKLKKTLSFEFTPIEKCISDVCEFMKKA